MSKKLITRLWQCSSSCLAVLIIGSAALLNAGDAKAEVDESIEKLSQWAEREDGATRDYYNRAAKLKWRNYMGDWKDAKNVAQGDDAYSVTSLIDDDVKERIEWDATALVKKWLNKEFPNQGFFVRAVGGYGTFNFRSREYSVQSQRPALSVELADGSIISLEPAADTYLEASTYKSQGDLETLRLSHQNPVLLRFDLQRLANAQIIKATLYLHVYEEYGSSTLETGIFRSSQSHMVTNSNVRLGLASQFAADEGIATHPDVYHFADFEQENWQELWSYVHGTVDTVQEDQSTIFAPLSGKALRIKIPEGDVNAMNMGFNFKEETGSEPDEVYFRYYLRFADDWETIEGGKLPGISGTYDTAGWGGRKSDGTNGWSARGAFLPPVPADNPVAGRVAVGNYVYHADMEDYFGDIYEWSDDYLGYFEKNRWYSVEQYVKLNTPGEKNGIMRAWVDGKLAHEKTNMRFRHVDSLKIEKIWMNIYHGGMTPVAQDSHAFIDNVVVAKRYIGPMVDNINKEIRLFLNADSMTIQAGETVTLDWVADNATDCTASGDWSGSKPVRGTDVVGPLSETSAFVLTCSGAAGSTKETMIVTVMQNPTDSVLDFMASPQVVSSGSTGNLQWKAENVSDCNGSGAWEGVKNSSGTAQVGPFSEVGDYTYNLECTAVDGSKIQQSVTIEVQQSQSPQPTVPDVDGNPIDEASAGGSGALGYLTLFSLLLFRMGRMLGSRKD